MLPSRKWVIWFICSPYPKLQLSWGAGMDRTKFMHLCPCFMKKGSFSGISIGKHSGWRTSLEMGPEPSGLQHWIPVALGLLSLDRVIMHYNCY